MGCAASVLVCVVRSFGEGMCVADRGAEGPDTETLQLKKLLAR